MPCSLSVVLLGPLFVELLVLVSVKLSVLVSVLSKVPVPVVVSDAPKWSRKLSLPVPLSLVLSWPFWIVVANCCCEKVPDSESLKL